MTSRNYHSAKNVHLCYSRKATHHQSHPQALIHTCTWYGFFCSGKMLQAFVLHSRTPRAVKTAASRVCQITVSPKPSHQQARRTSLATVPRAPVSFQGCAYCGYASHGRLGMAADQLQKQQLQPGEHQLTSVICAPEQQACNIRDIIVRNLHCAVQNLKAHTPFS